MKYSLGKVLTQYAGSTATAATMITSKADTNSVPAGGNQVFSRKYRKTLMEHIPKWQRHRRRCRHANAFLQAENNEPPLRRKKRCSVLMKWNSDGANETWRREYERYEKLKKFLKREIFCEYFLEII